MYSEPDDEEEEEEIAAAHSATLNDSDTNPIRRVRVQKQVAIL